MLTQDIIYKVRLGNSKPIGCPLDENLVVVRDDELLVFVGERPRAYVAIQGASPAGVALDVVALFAERLPIPQIVRTLPESGDLMVWAEFHIRFLRSARGACVSELLLEPSPFEIRQPLPWFALLAYIQALQLVASAFFSDGNKTFLALQFPHATKHIFVGALAMFGSPAIDGCPNSALSQCWSRNAMPRWPKRSQNDRVVKFIRSGRRNKASFGIGKPPFPAGLRLVRRGSRSDKKALTGSGFGHFAMVA